MEWTSFIMGIGLIAVIAGFATLVAFAIKELMDYKFDREQELFDHKIELIGSMASESIMYLGREARFSYGEMIDDTIKKMPGMINDIAKTAMSMELGTFGKEAES